MGYGKRGYSKCGWSQRADIENVKEIKCGFGYRKCGNENASIENAGVENADMEIVGIEDVANETRNAENKEQINQY